MHEFKDGELKSGKDGKGGKVKSREQAIAIGISEAKKSGAKVPKKKKWFKFQLLSNNQFLLYSIFIIRHRNKIHSCDQMNIRIQVV